MRGVFGRKSFLTGMGSTVIERTILALQAPSVERETVDGVGHAPPPWWVVELRGVFSFWPDERQGQ